MARARGDEQGLGRRYVRHRTTLDLETIDDEVRGACAPSSRRCLLLAGTGESPDEQGFAAGVFTIQEAGGVLHGDRGTMTRSTPLHGAALFDDHARWVSG